MFDAEGNIIPIHKLPDDVRATIKEVSYSRTGQLVYKTWSKEHALEMLAKHVAILKEVTNNTNVYINWDQLLSGVSGYVPDKIEAKIVESKVVESGPLPYGLKEQEQQDAKHDDAAQGPP